MRSLSNLTWVRWSVGLALLGLASSLLLALFTLPPAAIALPEQVAARLGDSGVSHPVTAVLLNFRGYDTLLEVAVLLLALLGMQAAGLPPPAPPGERNPLLSSLARLAVPLMVLAAVYLLWAGAHRPGGAFQAAAVLAAAAVLLHLAGLQPPWRPGQSHPPRLMAAGLLCFVAVAGGLQVVGGLLTYPPAQAGLWILLIESALTVSLAANLAAFFLLRAAPPPAREIPEISRSTVKNGEKT